MDHPKPWLRYVEAEDLGDSSMEFDGMNVEGSDGQTLGDVDGFIVDVASGRPYYVVVKSSGWFRSKFFLLPIGHVGLDGSTRQLVADIGRDRVERYPGFDRGEFEKLSDGELARMDEQIVGVCCPGEPVDRALAGDRFDSWAHYRAPGWWDASFYRPDRIDRTTVAGANFPSRDEVRAEHDRQRAR
jgi:PRC-barrel domain protein